MKLDSKNNKVDINKLFAHIWVQKLAIISFVVLVCLFSTASYLLRTDLKVAEIKVEVWNKPPSQTPPEVMADFQELFFLESSFKNWKKENPETKISFDYISQVLLLRSNVFLKSENRRMVIFNPVSRETGILMIKANEQEIVSELWHYTSNIAKVITERYSQRASTELEALIKFRKEQQIRSEILIFRISNILRFILKSNSSIDVIKISKASELKDPRMSLIQMLFLSLIVGFSLGLIGSLFHFLLRKKGMP